MTDKQFYTIRNLLSWIAIALFLLVSRQYLDVKRSDYVTFVGVMSAMFVIGFLAMMFIRMLLFVDPANKKESQPVGKATVEPTENDPELNLNGTFKK